MSDTTQDDDERDSSGALDGLAVETAVERVLDRGGDRDPETVRAALDYAAADGTVTAEALRESVEEASKLLATAETRTELARMALDDACEAAAPVADVPTVAARLEGFEREVAAVEERADALGPDFTEVVADRDPSAARFEVADGVRRMEERARAVQRAADDLQFELEDFERWLDSHALRVSEFDADLDAFESSLDDLADAVADVEAAGAEADAAARDPAAAWYDATLRHRVTDFTVADLRAELSDLRAWADRDGVDADPPAETDLAAVDARLAALDERRTDLGERLTAAARPAWRERYGADVEAFAAALDEQSPPVDWAVVGDVLADYRSRADGAD